MANPLVVDTGAGGAGTGTQTSVASSATNVALLASNTGRIGAAFYNDSTQIAYVLCAAGTSSATNYTVQMNPGAYYELPFGYTGAVSALWASAAGSMRITEWSA